MKEKEPVEKKDNYTDGFTILSTKGNIKILFAGVNRKDIDKIYYFIDDLLTDKKEEN